MFYENKGLLLGKGMQPSSLGSGEVTHADIHGKSQGPVTKDYRVTVPPTHRVPSSDHSVHNLEPLLGQCCQRGIFCVNWPRAKKEHEN